LVRISSDNKKAKKILQNIAETLTANGAYIDPDIEIRCQNNSISAHTDQNLKIRLAFQIPHELLLPYDLFEIGIKKDQFILKSTASKASPVQTKLIKAMLDLYNATDQLTTHRTACPWLFYANQPAIIKMLLKAREGDDTNALRKLLKDPDQNRDHLELLTFFKTRLLRCNLHKKWRKPSATLLPLVDSLNHHILGTHYNHIYTPNKGMLSLTARCPKGDGQCMASYGRLDSLDSYLHYAFIDKDAPFVRSIPATINLDNEITIEIHGLNVGINQEDLPEQLKGLDFYIPAIEIHHEARRIIFSHLFIPQDAAKLSMRRILGYSLKTLDSKINEEKYKQTLLQTEHKIVTTNNAYYQKLLNLYESVEHNQKNTDLKKLAQIQLKKIKNYMNFTS